MESLLRPILLDVLEHPGDRLQTVGDLRPERSLGRDEKKRGCGSHTCLSLSSRAWKALESSSRWGLLLLTASARIAAIGKKDQSCGAGHFLLEPGEDRLEVASLVTRPPRQTVAGPRTQVSRRSGRSSRTILSKLSCTQWIACWRDRIRLGSPATAPDRRRGVRSFSSGITRVSADLDRPSVH